MEAKLNSEKSGKTEKRPVLLFILSLLVSLALTYFLKEPGFTQSQVYVLFLLFFALFLWITEAIPAFSVGLFIIAYLVFALGNPHFNSNPENIEKYANTFSSSNIWLMLGGFFLAAAMSKTRLDQSLFSFTLKVSGSKPRNLLLGIMTSTMIASMVMSNTAAAAMVLAAIMPLLKTLDQKSGIGKALLLSISLSATTGGMATIIGTPPNIIAAGALENAGEKIDFLQWMKYGVPLTLSLTALACVLLILFYIKDNSPLSVDFLNQKEDEMSRDMMLKRKITVVVLIVTLLLWLTGEWHGIGVAAVTAVPIVILPLTGILTEKDVRSLPWDTLLLIAGALSLGVALKTSGLLTYYAEQLKEFQFSELGFLMIFGFISMAVSNVMSHTASTSILVPIGLVILPEAKIEMSLAIALASSCALMLPVSTPPNAIVYSTGRLQQKDFLPVGSVIGIIGTLLTVFCIYLLS